MFKAVEIVKATKGCLLKGSPSLDIKGVSADSRSIKAKELFIALKGKNFDGHDFLLKAAEKGAAAFLIEGKFIEKDRQFLTTLPKGSVCICVVDTLRALGDLALFWRKKFSIPIIAVTGSSGKTTTKEMIASVLDEDYRVLKASGTENNFVGVPLNLLKLESGHEIACLELGTSSYGEIARLTEIVRPSLGIITNIGEAHLEKLKTKGGVFKEKSALLKALIMPAISLLNYDDGYLKSLRNSRKNIFGFSRDNPSDFFASRFYLDKHGLNFKLSSGKQKFAIRTFGVHNIYNSLAAIGAGVIFGLDQTSIAKRLAAFEFPASRFNIIKKKSFTIVDDTYNANPLSLRFALLSLAAIKNKGRKILVIADMLELGDEAAELHRQIGVDIARQKFDYIISMGNLASNVVVGALEGGFNRNKTFSVLDYGQTIDKLKKILKKGDIILVKGSHAMHMERVVRYLSKYC